MSTETPFAETEALLAVMNGDPERAEEIVGCFLRAELLTFDRQVTLLHDLITRAIYRMAIKKPANDLPRSSEEEHVEAASPLNDRETP